MAEIVNGYGGPKVGWFIDEKGHGHTNATTSPKEEDKAHDGDALVVHAECHTAAAASGGLLSLKNVSSDKELHIGRVEVNGYTITPTDLIVTMNISPTATITSGTDVSTSSLIQKNTLKAVPTASTIVEIKISDSAANMTFTGSAQHHALPVKTMTPHQFNFQGTNVIGPSGYFILGWKTVAGGNATDGEIVSITVNFYIDNSDERT